MPPPPAAAANADAAVTTPGWPRRDVRWRRIVRRTPAISREPRAPERRPQRELRGRLSMAWGVDFAPGGASKQSAATAVAKARVKCCGPAAWARVAGEWRLGRPALRRSCSACGNKTRAATHGRLAGLRNWAASPRGLAGERPSMKSPRTRAESRPAPWRETRERLASSGSCGGV